MARLALSQVNSMDRAAFAAAFGAVFEHSPWVAERAFARGPFEGAEALHAAMMACVLEARRAEQLALIRAHPELAGREAGAGTLGAHSGGEQARLGFTALGRAESERMAGLNRRYREKFGFPCIIALRRHASRDSVLAEMERRLANDEPTEVRNALGEIAHITRGRLAQLLEEP
jgi:chitin deacetylase